MAVKATFHMDGGDFTMIFESQKTFHKINKSEFRTLLLLESKDNMSDEFKAWLDFSLRHGNGPSVPRFNVDVVDFDEDGNVTECYCCTQTSPRRWFTKMDTIREIELDYMNKI